MSRIRLSGAVMVHPSRPEPGLELVRSNRPGFLDLVVDPVPDGPPTGLRTAMRAWSSIPAGSTHHLVLEDDAVLIEGFEEHARAAASAAPGAAIAFHANWSCRSGSVIRLGALAGERWARAAQEYTPTVALLLPAEVGAGFPDFAREHGGTWADDVVMARYLRHVGVSCLLTVPNIVEHGDFPSTTDNDYHGLRLSACYTGSAPTSPSKALPSEAEVVPFFKFGMAQVAVRRPATGRFLTVDAEHGFRHIGVDIARCRREFDETLAAMPEVVDVLPERLSRTALPALWRTAYALGFLSRRPSRFPDPLAQLAMWADDPAVAAAVRSIAPGGLCTALGSRDLSAVCEPLAGLAWRALHAGFHDRQRRSRVRVVAPDERTGHVVVVAPPRDAVAACLEADLADRGLRVVRTDGGAGLELAAHSPHGVVHVAGDQTPVATDAQLAVESAAGRAGARRVVHMTGLDAHRASSGDAGSGAEPIVATVLTVGVVYGPEIECVPLNDFVADSLVKQPIVVDPRYPTVRYTHIWDVCAAVHHALEADRPSRHYDVVGAESIAPADLARLVSRTVKPVPVELLDHPGGPAHAAPPVSTAAWPTIALADGIRTVAQWLAYEAGPAGRSR